MNDEELKEKYLLKGYPKLETSTVALIKEAIKQGINYEIIDEDRSFIKLYNNNNQCHFSGYPSQIPRYSSAGSAQNHTALEPR